MCRRNVYLTGRCRIMPANIHDFSEKQTFRPEKCGFVRKFPSFAQKGIPNGINFT